MIHRLLPTPICEKMFSSLLLKYRLFNRKPFSFPLISSRTQAVGHPRSLLFSRALFAAGKRAKFPFCLLFARNIRRRSSFEEKMQRNNSWKVLKFKWKSGNRIHNEWMGLSRDFFLSDLVEGGQFVKCVTP